LARSANERPRPEGTGAKSRVRTKVLTRLFRPNAQLVSIGGNRAVGSSAYRSSRRRILAVPTAIAGIYGMNFEYMPELKWAHGLSRNRGHCRHLHHSLCAIPPQRLALVTAYAGRPNVAALEISPSFNSTASRSAVARLGPFCPGSSRKSQQTPRLNRINDKFKSYMSDDEHCLNLVAETTDQDHVPCDAKWPKKG
jgi:Mg2+ and Co2+ transporter CorA